MRIRRFQSEDAGRTADLFRDTVKRVSSRDYSPDQIEAWAPDDMDGTQWCCRLQKGLTYVAESDEGELLGFISIDRVGHIDLLYSHADHQRQGVGSGLLRHVESLSRASGIACFSTEASITARPFFERQGFKVIEEHIARRHGSSLVNYLMEKKCLDTGR